MEQGIFLLYDPEEEYTHRFLNFIKKERRLPWEPEAYTRKEELIRRARERTPTMLVVAESAYEEEFQKLKATSMVILNESGLLRFSELPNVDKYQSADAVLQQLLQIYLEREPLLLPRIGETGVTRLIGLYSPVRRCLQSTFGLCLSQLLATEMGKRVLYLNFEHYVGMEELIPKKGRDLSCLLYFLQTDREKFLYRLRTMISRNGGFDYMCGMQTGVHLLSVTSAEWQQLLGWILESGIYDTVILDLSENLQGLFEILRLCSRVYTMVKDDAYAECKRIQYEQLIQSLDYQDVLDKTRYCRLPLFRELPREMENFTHSELAGYIRRILQEEEGR